jgi:6-pyruvoyl-tetrahydropterin synthase
MIAHSLAGEVFGPAQRLHGATFVVDVAFFREELNAHNIVVDIGLASEALKKILAELNFSNLDEVPTLQGKITTTEFLARYIFDRTVDCIGRGELGEDARGIERIRVQLHESHVARAWYEGAVKLS